MEILKSTSKSGKVFRIYKEFESWDLFVIEFLKIGKCEDGTDFRMWYPAYEPKNKVFSSIDEAKIAFAAFLQS